MDSIDAVESITVWFPVKVPQVRVNITPIAVPTPPGLGLLQIPMWECHSVKIFVVTFVGAVPHVQQTQKTPGIRRMWEFHCADTTKMQKIMDLVYIEAGQQVPRNFVWLSVDKLMLVSKHWHSARHRTGTLSCQRR